MYDADTCISKTRLRQEIKKTRMVRWMCEVTRRGKIRNEHIRGTARVVKASTKITEKSNQVIRSCEENERGARRGSGKNARCGHTRERRKSQPYLR